MNKLKTAEELFEEYKTEHSNGLGFFVWKKQFIKALTEDRQQIKALIDDFIEDIGGHDEISAFEDIEISICTKLRNKLFPKE